MAMSERPVVVQHSFGDPGSGGPVGALERILESDLKRTTSSSACTRRVPLARSTWFGSERGP